MDVQFRADPALLPQAVPGCVRFTGDACVLERVSPARLQAMLPVPAGRHRYKFVVDGTDWIADPANPWISKDGQNNSCLTVGMRVILDWTLNRSSIDHPFTRTHPHWYARRADGSVYSGGPSRDAFTGLDFAGRTPRRTLIDSMSGWIARCGFDGLRFDDAGITPCDFLDEIRAAPAWTGWQVLFDGRRLDRKAFDAGLYAHHQTLTGLRRRQAALRRGAPAFMDGLPSGAIGFIRSDGRDDATPAPRGRLIGAAKKIGRHEDALKVISRVSKSRPC